MLVVPGHINLRPLTAGMIGSFVSYLEQRAGNHLRCIVTSDRHDSALHSLREELNEPQIQSKLATIPENLPASTTSTDMQDSFGEQYVTLQARQEAVILNLPWNQKAGILASLEPTPRQLTSIIDESIKRGTTQNSSP